LLVADDFLLLIEVSKTLEKSLTYKENEQKLISRYN